MDIDRSDLEKIRDALLHSLAYVIRADVHFTPLTGEMVETLARVQHLLNKEDD